MFHQGSANVIARRLILLVLWGMCFGFAKSQSTEQAAVKPQSSILVLRGGRLVDGTGRAPLENSVVVIEGTKILRVGEAGKVAIPAGAKVVDTTGKTIIPGL